MKLAGNKTFINRFVLGICKHSFNFLTSEYVLNTLVDTIGKQK